MLSGRASKPSSSPRPTTVALGAFDVPRELKLLPLLTGIGVLFALGLAALVGAVSLAGRQADDLVTIQSREQIGRVLGDRAGSLAMLTADWAWWNEAIEKLVLQPDRAYADTNLGEYTAENFDLFASLVIDPDDAPIFGYREGLPLPDGAQADQIARLAPLIAATRRDSEDGSVPATAYMELDGQIVLVAAAAMMAEEGSPPVGWARPAVLVFLRALDRPFLDSLAEAAGVEALELAAAADGRPSYALPGLDGAPVALVTWQVRLPSETILSRLWPIGAAIALIMLCLGGLVALSLVRHAGSYHRHRAAQEQRLLTAMLESREASHAKSLFLANMSHELRTPLNAVIGYAQLLRLSYVGPLTEKQHEYVDSIEGAGRHLLSLLQDILDLSKIEAGREDLEEADVSIEEAVGKAIALTAPRARERSARIAVDGGAPILLRADGRRLLQMILNLLSNAVRFTPKDGTVTVGWFRRGDGAIVVFVGDEGPGIQPADMARVLEPFHRRLDNTAHHAGESNGLGLPLTARIMTLHAGRLELANQTGGGLRVSLVFPASRDRGAAAGPHDAPGPRQPPLPAAMRPEPGAA